MELTIRADARAFVVLNAEATTVERLRFLLQSRRFAWVVLHMGEAFYLFSGTELRHSLRTAKSSDPLAFPLKLKKQRPSVVVDRLDRTVTMEDLPTGDAVARRAVVVRKNKTGQSRILAIGSLRKVPVLKLKGVVIGKVPRSWGVIGDSVRKPMKKKVAAMEKTIVKEVRDEASGDLFRIRPGKSRGFGFVQLDEAPSPGTKPEPAKDYETVEVFYATDRKQRLASTNDGVVRFLNVLPDPVELRYGVCSVTVPQKHELGKIETPSIWTLKIQIRSKHFTISACSPRTKGEFFKQLSERIGKSKGQSSFVFIHGYNVDFDDAAMRTAQLAKDLKFPGVPILYSWASAHKLSGYSQDEETVSLTIKRLTVFLKQLKEMSGVKEIHLIAHSMGNRALIAALERLDLPDSKTPKPFKQVVLTAPDVPRKDVESLIEAAGLRAERVTLYASRKDKALGISKAKHKYERLGKVYGFPYVLAGMDSIDASDVRTDFLAHTVFAKTRTVLGDLKVLIDHGDPPDQRLGLEQLKSPAGICWKFSL